MHLWQFIDTWQNENNKHSQTLIATTKTYPFFLADPWPEPVELNATDAVNQRWL